MNNRKLFKIIKISLLCVLMCFNANFIEPKSCESNQEISKGIKQVNRIESNDNLSALNELLAEYYVMYEQDSSDERIIELISKTEEMISFLENNELCEYDSRIGGVGTQEVLPALTFQTATSLVIDAIAAFSVAGLKLSAELLTVAFGNTDETRHYTPIYGGRVISSSLTKAIADGSSISSVGEEDIVFKYSTSQNMNEVDLSMSLHGFSYTKPYSSSKVVNITDTYDFDFSLQENPFITIANGTFAVIQRLGVIKTYNVDISVDFSKDLDIFVESFSSGTYSINVTNNTSDRQLIVYNDRMCNLEDARNWTNLTDIDYFYLNSGENRSVSVSERGTATSVAFSYVSGTTRYISSAYQLSVGGSLSKEQTSADHYSYYNFDIIGKDGNEWIMKFNNENASYVNVDYNYKMCNYSDARDWTNLRHQASMNVSPFAKCIFRIEENGTAGSIAVRYRVGSYYYYVYANNLSPDTSMSAETRSEYYYEYLSLTNNGKSNSKWKIVIHNPKSYSLTVSYNSKMCFQSDAISWNNLRNVISVTIPAYESVEVEIYTNGTAGFITTCYIENNKRIITCANGLSTSGAIVPRYNVTNI